MGWVGVRGGIGWKSRIYTVRDDWEETAWQMVDTPGLIFGAAAFWYEMATKDDR